MISFVCPRCAYVVDATASVNMVDPENIREPHAGDITVCMACGAILEFRADGAPRWLTLEEFGLLDVVAQAEIAQVIVAIVCQRGSMIRHVRAPQAVHP